MTDTEFTEFEVPDGVERERADKILSARHPNLSRAGVQRAFEAGLVILAGKPLKKNSRVSAGDVIRYRFPEVVSTEVRPVDIPLDVLFEDEHMIAINKASGMVVHPGAGTGEDTLVHALLSHCQGQLSGIGGVERPGIVHRLDRETSGVMVVAKTDAAHRALAADFAARELTKEYLALVSGVPELLSGSIRKPIARNAHQRHKMTVVDTGEGREAHTDWELVEAYGNAYSLLRCQIHTGRTHQIRVHLKSIGHSIMGDSIYGYKPDARIEPGPERVMLHAEHLCFLHPISREEVDLRAEPPTDFTQLQERLRDQFGSKRSAF